LLSTLAAENRRLLAGRNEAKHRLAAVETELANVKSQLNREREQRVAREAALNEQMVTIGESLQQRPGRDLLQTSGRVERWDDSGWRKVNTDTPAPAEGYFSFPAVQPATGSIQLDR
jgi:hypothetical protein